MKISKLWMLIPLMAGAMCLADLAPAETNLKPGEAIEGEAVLLEVEVTATITKINKKTREVTVKTKDGDKYSFFASDDVENFAQMKKGDVITATYVEALAYEVIKGGTEVIAEAAVGAAKAEPGEKPAGFIGEQITVNVTIAAIDMKEPSVTFEGADGYTRTIKVVYPEKLKSVKVGDTVALTYTEAMAIKVEKAKK